MNIGIDIGWTIWGVRAENDKTKIAPDSFRIIRDWVDQGHKIYIISKVNEEQRSRVENFLTESKFFQETGVSPDNFYFCWERKDKAIFAKALGLDVMIDDRPEVMAYMSKDMEKILIDPEAQELEHYRPQLANYALVNSWEEIEEIFPNIKFNVLMYEGLRWGL